MFQMNLLFEYVIGPDVYLLQIHIYSCKASNM